MIRRYGDAPTPGKRHVLRPGAYAILPRRGRFLVTVQSTRDDDVQLPGGGIEPGESPLSALHREVHEETGWHIARPRHLGVFRRFTFMPEYGIWAEKLCHVYVARPTLPHGPPVEPGHTAVWMSGSEALAMLGNDGDAAFLARYLCLECR